MMSKFFRGYFLLVLLIAGCVYSLGDYQTSIKKGIDLEGGSELLYEIPLENVPASQRSSVASDVKDVISARFDSFGLKEISVAISGNNRLLIQLPGSDNDALERLKGQIERAGQLNIHLVSAEEYSSPTVVAEIEADMTRRKQAMMAYNSLPVDQQDPQLVPKELDRIVTYRKPDENGNRGEAVVVENGPENRVSGSFIQSASSGFDQTSAPAVNFTFGGAGSTLFGNLTQNVGRSLAIVLDGVAVSVATINEPIYSRGQISGSFTRAEVEDIVTLLRAGSLPTKPVLKSQQTVGSVLGKESVDRGTQAMIYGFLLVVVFMLLYYRAAGLVANLSLFFNLMLVLTLLVIFRNTLTFPGMAGMLLTVGMAVDANILIFERIREERDRGKQLPAAFKAGFQRAFWTIFDANLTTLITAFVLFQFGTGPVKGFAVVLSIGIFTSFFCSIFVSRLLLSSLIDAGVIKELKMGRLVSKTSIDFMSMRGAARVLSIILVLGGLFALIYRGSDAMGIDFTGGTKLVVNLTQPTSEGELRNTFKGLATGDGASQFEDLQMQSLYDQGQSAGSDLATRYSLKTKTLGSGTEETEAFKDEVESVLAEKGLLAPNAIVVDRDPVDEADETDVVGAAKKYVFTAELNAMRGEGDEGVTASKVEEAILATGFPVAAVTEKKESYGEGIVTFEVRSEAQENSTAALALHEVLTQNLKDVKGIDFSEPFPEYGSISGKVAQDMQGKTFVALMISFLAIIFYISIRFELRFGMAAIVALVHDILFTLGAMAVGDYLLGDMLNLKINLPVVAALLTVVGYSLNDTIVIFDRIRENLVDTRRDANYNDIVNKSINQTLSRTLLTSLTTFLVVSILLIFGGDGLQAFSFALCAGIVVGTYSSIFVASPALVHFQEKARMRREQSLAEAALKG
ncbi:MAG: protein translocase subunit SecD [Planctomycetes bacterium]|jgi:SecD/SecF fusion protein|nr:protein translocase subunit SecD [Planctomycetota bacterium]MBT7639192.1 protein translocase subunit SecD [Planctomycetota bacterium]